MTITFRPLTDVDLPMLHRWLNEPRVVQWWEGQDVSWEGVVRNYGAASNSWREQWIAMEDEREVGWLQCYLARDNPDETEHWWRFGIDDNAAGIDYLIANPGDRGRGLGSTVIREFARTVVFARHRRWSQVCAGPFDANVASWKALEKAGFRCVGVIDDDEDGACRLMALDRDSGAIPP